MGPVSQDQIITANKMMAGSLSFEYHSHGIGPDGDQAAQEAFSRICKAHRRVGLDGGVDMIELYLSYQSLFSWRDKDSINL